MSTPSSQDNNNEPVDTTPYSKQSPEEEKSSREDESNNNNNSNSDEARKASDQTERREEADGAPYAASNTAVKVEGDDCKDAVAEDEAANEKKAATPPGDVESSPKKNSIARNRSKSTTTIGAGAGDPEYQLPEVLLPRESRNPGFFAQFGTLQKKNFLQKKRTPVGCALELFLPILFVLGLIGAWSAADVTLNPPAHFVPEDSSALELWPIVQSQLCTNKTDTLPGIPACNVNADNATNITECIAYDPWFGDGIPFDGLCYTVNKILVANQFRNIAANALDQPRIIYSLDEMTIIRWWARGITGDLNVGIANYLAPSNGLSRGMFVFFTPDDTNTARLVDWLNSTYETFQYSYGGVYSTTLELEDDILRNRTFEGRTWTWLHTDSMTTELVDIQIRQNKSDVPWPRRVKDPFRTGPGRGFWRNYWTTGFQTWMLTLQEFTLKEVKAIAPAAVDSQPQIVTGMMPWSNYRDSEFLIVAGGLCPLALTLAYLYSVSQLVKRIVEEKEYRIREAMMIMGLHKGAFYFSWITSYMIQNFFSAIIMTILLKSTILAQGDPTLLFVILLLFSCSTVTFASMVSSFFSKSRVSAIMAPLIFFATSVPTFTLDPDETSRETYLAISILSPSAFGTVTRLLFNYERARGAGWQDLNSANDQVKLYEGMLFLLGDFILYFLIGVYLDAVLPSEWGTRLHPLCCLWCKSEEGEGDGGEDMDIELNDHSSMRVADSSAAAEKNKSTGGGSYPEIQSVVSQNDISMRQDTDSEVSRQTGAGGTEQQEVPASPNRAREKSTRSSKEASVKIRNLTKKFEIDGQVKTAVNQLSLDMFENEVTVLLGHNGAGKTTTINMLTGMLPVSSGDCVINGRSIRTQMREVRNNVGLCPQHNILWNELTVQEHLDIYAGLKGYDATERSAAVEAMIDACDLSDFADTFAGALSGGNKRKLSVANSFIGGAKLVFLDEPSAGMDVVARRHTWELIRHMSAGRTIVLTTHYMDEADLLGSQIAIMNHGEIFCSGSPLYLKTNMGAGYSLTVQMNSDAEHEKVLELVNSIAACDVVSSRPGEVVLRLPATAVPLFPAILSPLEENKAEYGVRAVNISVTTLEEVFLRISESSSREEAQQRLGLAQAPTQTAVEQIPEGDACRTEGDDKDVIPAGEPGELAAVRVDQEEHEDSLWPSGVSKERQTTFGRQFSALMTKRWHNAKRDRRTQCLQVVTPVICILLAMALAQVQVEKTPNRRFTPEMYEQTTDIVIDDCGDLPDYLQQLGGDWYNVVTPPDSPLQDAYNFSEYLMETFDFHDNERNTAIKCKGATNNRTIVLSNTTAWQSNPEGVFQWLQGNGRKIIGDKSFEMYFRNNQFPFTSRESQQLDALITLIVAFFLLIPFTFIPSTFVAWVVKEKELKAKHLQQISGVKFTAYWTSNLVFDLASMLSTQALMYIIFAMFGREEYIGTGQNFGACFLCFFFYGLASIAGAYVSSFWFDTHGQAQNVVLLVNFISGFMIVILVYFLSLIESTEDAAKILKFFFRIIPSYSLGEGILALATADVERAFLGQEVNPLEMDRCGWAILYLALEFPIFMILAVFLDHPARTRAQQKLLHNPETVPPSVEDEDEDVTAERNEIEQNEAGHRDELVRVKNLCKKFDGLNGERVAIQNLSFGVLPGEIFAFLGTNGAGKTTTMNVLTGQTMPTHGYGYIKGQDVVEHGEAARENVGYCPQFDALLDLLTPEEHLYLFATLRGVESAGVSKVVEHLLQLCHLTEYRNVPSSSLSGGNKRKLSVAIALVGAPPVLFLDEPSAGMDPGTRRKLWAVIQRAAKKSSVILTTHHLEEVEVLGDRVAIMVAGALRCIGPLSHLKSKFGGGLEVVVKMKKNDLTEDLLCWMEKTFEGSELLENKQGRCTFNLPLNDDTKLATIFQQFIDNSEELGIQDYSVSQGSLEHVFLRISEENQPADDGAAQQS